MTWLPTVLSIQSHMVHGRSGNRAAVFPLEASGVSCDVLNTCQYSAHTAYPYLKGTVLTTPQFQDIVDGLRLNGILPMYTHLLTGFIADASIASGICTLRRQLGEKVKYFCDPVLGDCGRMYNSEACLAALKSELVPLANTVTPNTYEAMWLTGKTIRNQQELFDVVKALHDMGPENVVITSTEWNHRIAFFSWNRGERRFAVESPSIPRKFDGPGDVFTSLLLANCIKFPGEYEKIAKRTVGSVFAVLKTTHDLDTRELALPQSVEAIVRPPEQFDVIEIEDLMKLEIEDHTIATKE